jgi:hypothetical protein
MPLPHTFVGFSTTDIQYYHLMCAWKEHEHIDFDFADFQLDDSILGSAPESDGVVDLTGFGKGPAVSLHCAV